MSGGDERLGMRDGSVAHAAGIRRIRGDDDGDAHG
jgi:hypothetical protein